MGEVVQIETFKPHLSGEAKCIQCGHRWIAVAPVGTVWLTCPKCTTEKGCMIGPVIPETTWQCHCGNSLFYVVEEGVVCPVCGVTQVFQ